MTLVLALSACASTGRDSRPDGILPRDLAAERKVSYAAIDEWKIRGRIGIKSGYDGFSGALEWLQKGEDFDIKLLDPLGRKVIWLRGDEHSVNLDTSEGKKLQAQDPEKLLIQHIGWTLPVRSLLYWVKGLPDPAAVVWMEEYDNQGRILRIRQGGWNVRFSKYMTKGDRSFPGLTRFERQDFSVKLLVQDWQ